MSKIIKVGIIGTGFGARVHAPMFQEHPNFEVQAIASVARGRTEDIKAQTGLEQVYTDWKEMLAKEELDLVAVTSAPFLHHEMVLEALRSGKDVLCEKPMAFDAQQSLEMIQAKNEANKKGFINFEFRFGPARQKVKEVLQEGKLGRIMHISYTTVMPGYERSITGVRGWLGQEDKAGGYLGALGSHMLDTLMWLTGERITSVYGQLHTYVPKNVGANEAEQETRTADDAFQVLGSFSSGTSMQMNLISTARHGSGAKLEIYGTEGTLIMTDDQIVSLGIGGAPLEEIELAPTAQAPEHFTPDLLRYFPAFYPMLDRLYAALTDSEAAQVATFEDGHAVQLVMDAIRVASKTGQRQEVKF